MSFLFKNSVLVAILSIFIMYFLVFKQAYAAVENENQLIQERFEDQEELIITLLLDKYVLGESFVAINSDKVAYDLNSFFELIDFPIKYDNSTRSFVGWYIREGNEFSLSPLTLEDGKLTIYYSGKTRVLEDSDYMFIDDTFYLNDHVISEVFSVSFEYDFKKLVGRIIPTVNLPILERLAREAKTVSLVNNKTIKYVNLPRGYELLSPQTLDFNLSSSYREQQNNFTANYSLSGARDIALVHSEFSLLGDTDDALRSGRLTLSRESIDADMLGIFGASSVKVGDIRPVRQALGTTSQETRGIFISNAPLDNKLETEVVTFDGDVPLGWDAQIFRQGILLAQQTDIQTGRYEFVDVPLVFGENIFEIVLYGPQGQIIRRQERRLLDRRLYSLKKTQYQLSINDADNSFLGLDKIRNQKALGYNVSGQVSTGLNDSSVLQLGYQGQFGGELSASTVNLAISSIVNNNILLNMASTLDDNKNVSFSTIARTTLFNQSVSAEYRFSDNFDSDLVSNRNDSVTLGIEGHVPLWGDAKLPYQNRFSYSDDGTTKQFFANSRLSIYNPWFSVFNTFQYAKVSSDVKETESQKGSLSMQKSFGRLFFRYSNSYSLNEGFELLNHRAEMNWSITNNVRTRMSYSYNLLDKISSSRIQLGWHNDLFQIFGTASYSDTAGSTIGLNTRFSLAGQNSSYGNIYSTSRGLANSGSIAVRVFDDVNMNAKYDDGEQVIQGVKVSAKQVYRHAFTDNQGIAMITGVSSFKTSDIELDSNTFPDPYLAPLVDGVSITFRAGLVDTLDFPLTIGSEIEGLVSFKNNKSLFTRQGIVVELKNYRGQVIKETKTESDGYYIFEGVIPGKYTVQVNQNVAKNYEVLDNLSLDVEVSRKTEYIAGVDIHLPVQSYQDGFIATIGEFKNEDVMNAFRRLLERKYPTLKGSFFTTKTLNSGVSYTRLNTLYSLTQAEIIARCNDLIAVGTDCKVNFTRIPIKH